MPSREIHDVDGNYAGYASFDNDGKFLGTRGGYGPRRRGIRPDRTGNNRNNDASRLQNKYVTGGMNQIRNKKRAFAPFRR